MDTNEDVWADVQKDVADAGVTHTLTNPGIHDEDLDTNVYMFATNRQPRQALCPAASPSARRLPPK